MRDADVHSVVGPDVALCVVKPGPAVLVGEVLGQFRRVPVVEVDGVAALELLVLRLVGRLIWMWVSLMAVVTGPAMMLCLFASRRGAGTVGI